LAEYLCAAPRIWKSGGSTNGVPEPLAFDLLKDKREAEQASGLNYSTLEKDYAWMADAPEDLELVDEFWQLEDLHGFLLAITCDFTPARNLHGYCGSVQHPCKHAAEAPNAK
jgi:hypothetical protein